jgi:O-antigen/teichoic acid export membrane protein
VVDEPSVASVGRNAILTFLGQAAPLVVALAATPIYLDLIGPVRYGVLATVWALFTQFSIFDLGVGRIATNRIARQRAPADRERIFWTALSLNLLLGTVGAATLLLVGYVAVGAVFDFPGELQSEIKQALPMLAAAVPVLTVSHVFTGALEGIEEFGVLTARYVVGALLFQTSPLVVAALSGPNLTWLIAATVVSSIIGSAWLFLACWRRLPLTGFVFDRNLVSHVVREGGWFTVSGVLSPFFATVDRLVIAGVAGARAVTHYVIPSSVVVRLLIVASSVHRPLFPRFSSLREPEELRRLEGIAISGMATFMTPVVVIGLVLVEPFLELWVGASLARASAHVGEILFLGVWLNSLTIVPFALLQSRGRADVTAKFQLLEVLPYLVALWVGLSAIGVEGAAWAWSGRIALDAALLFWATHRWRLTRDVFVGAGLVLAAFIAATTVYTDDARRAVVGAALATASVAWAWRASPLTPRLRRFFAASADSMTK